MHLHKIIPLNQNVESSFMSWPTGTNHGAPSIWCYVGLLCVRYSTLRSVLIQKKCVILSRIESMTWYRSTDMLQQVLTHNWTGNLRTLNQWMNPFHLQLLYNYEKTPNFSTFVNKICPTTPMLEWTMTLSRANMAQDFAPGDWWQGPPQQWHVLYIVFEGNTVRYDM